MKQSRIDDLRVSIMIWLRKRRLTCAQYVYVVILRGFYRGLMSREDSIGIPFIACETFSRVSRALTCEVVMIELHACHFVKYASILLIVTRVKTSEYLVHLVIRVNQTISLACLLCFPVFTSLELTEVGISDDKLVAVIEGLSLSFQELSFVQKV